MPQEYTVCPSCGARYRTADYHVDKLRCEKCGREIAVRASVELAHEEKEVKRFFLRKAWDMTFAFLIGLPTLIVFGVLLLYLPISKWWGWGVLFLGLMGPLVIFAELKACIKVWTILKRNGFRLEESIAEFDFWWASLETDSRPDSFKDFPSKLRLFVAAQSNLKEDYQATGTGRPGAPLAPEPLQPSPSSPSQENRDVYEIPPEKCPRCGYFYSAAALGGREITCSRCGWTIQITGNVDIEQIKALYRRFAKDIIMGQLSPSMVLMGIVGGLVIYCLVQWIRLGDLFTLVFSWHGIAVYSAWSLTYGAWFMARETLAFYSSLRSGDLDLVDIEHFIKYFSSGDEGLGRERLYKLKADVLALYGKGGLAPNGGKSAQ